MPNTGNITIVAGEALTVHRFVKADGTYVDNDTDIPFALTLQTCTEVGDLIDGTRLSDNELMEYTGSAPAVGDFLEGTTDGKVVVDNSPENGDWILGTCTQAGVGGFCRGTVYFRQANVPA